MRTMKRLETTTERRIEIWIRIYENLKASAAEARRA